MAEITVNTTDYELRLAREGLLGFAGSLDAKRPRAWDQYGYPQTITFDMMLTAYERGGPAFGAVHRILDKCWQARPRIKRKGADAESTFETKIADAITAIGGWQKLRDFDRRNMVGRYAGLIYRVADGKRLSEPMAKAQRLVDIVPVYEGQLRVTDWHSDERDADNFGKPRMFQYRRRSLRATDTQGQPDEWADVHPSRLQILAEGSVGDMFDGVPLLRAGFNHLIDLEKIGGGSAESFLKNSARTLVLKFDANGSPQQLADTPGSTAATDIKAAIEAKTQALNRNIDSSLVLQGGEASTLQTTVSDPTGAFQLAANLFAASVQIPFTVLFGQQTGRLASDEDMADMIARCVSRQANVQTPMVEEFVKRMQAAGVFEAGEFEVEWEPLDAPSEGDKFANLVKLTTAMKDAAAAGLTEPLFDANELRGVAGFEERVDDGMSGEGDPDADPLGDPLAAPAAPGATQIRAIRPAA